MRVRVLAAPIIVAVGLASGMAVGCGESGETTVTTTVTEPTVGSTDSGGPDPPEPNPPEPRLVDYTASLYTARVPADWKLEKDESSSGDFLRSQWRHPDDPNTSVLIDAVDGEAESPVEKATAVRDATSTTPGYREVSFGPTTLGGLDAYRWVFLVSGDERVDYFMNECGVGIAVLGSTSPSTYDEHAGVFRRVAKSVQAECADPGPGPAPPEPTENCEDGYDPCVPPYSEGDVDCADVGGPVAVTGDDPHGLDADGDGVGCE